MGMSHSTYHAYGVHVPADQYQTGHIPVSYTHLTLPTKA